jgi:DNA-3-methyladenine glycosylase II
LEEKVIHKAIRHLKKDVKMNALILKYDKPKFHKSSNYFYELSKYIIFQQLSGKSASAIHNRFLTVFNNKPNPKEILQTKNIFLNRIGLSKQKIDYLKQLSKYFLKKGSVVDFELLNDMQVYDELIQIKGIGQWTIDMFLMFALYRTNILPVNDLGIKKGFKILFNLKELPTNNDMIEKSIAWEPYRTIASLYLWQIIDEDSFW